MIWQVFSMIIKPISSSSKGNAYLIADGRTAILVECGLPFSELKKISNFEVPMNIHACLISHGHMDHSKAVKDLLNASVDCYMLKETAEAKGILEHHRTKLFTFNQQFSVGSLIIMPLEMHHDIPCSGFLIYSNHTNEKLLFATDTYMIKHNIPGLDYIMIEANYDMNLISDDEKKNRTFKSHMSIDTCIRYLKTIDLSKVKEIYLMHLSERNSNAEEFKKKVQAATGRITLVCNE